VSPWGGGEETRDAGDVILYTDKKEKKIFLIYKEIQKTSVAKSCMPNGPLIYG
jgi:hypothetical protein